MERSNKISKDMQFAKLLATGGYQMDRDIQQRTKEVIKRFPLTNVFKVSIAQSLTWTGHVIIKPDYYQRILEFFETGSETALSGLKDCSGRYGTENLRSTAFNLRKLYAILPMIDMSKAKIEEIIDFHNECLEVACKAYKDGRITGIGAWLFCASFKILLCLRDDLWSHKRIDEIRMPLGIEVIRGVKKMIRKEYSYCESIDTNMLSEEDGGILEGLATVEMVQSISKKIAKDANSIVLHINSGFWRFGAGDL